MGPIQVVVQDGNNLVLEVTPTPSTTVILDRGIPGPVGPMGDGDVDGPASSTDNAVARFDGTTGKVIQNSAVTVSDTGAVAGVTTLAASGAVTLSGGVANGVSYLNGSKVLTTGSALTFDGSRLNVYTGSSFAVAAAFGNATGSRLVLLNDDGGSSIRYDAERTGGGAMSHVWLQNGSEQMRLTSTGLGIGTSSPAAKLELSGSTAQNLIVNSTGSSSYMQFANSGGITGYIGSSGGINSGGGNNALGFRSQNEMVFATGGSTERMRLDSPGNLGLGVTPSAWGGGTKALQFSSGYVMGVGSGALLYMGANNYFDGSNYRYVNTASATQYSQTNGAHNWLNAPSGTAGNAISFTQAMTLGASGNLGIGVTSPAQILELKKGAGANAYIEIAGNNNTPNSTSMLLGQGSDNSAYCWNRANAALLFGTNNTERARIDSSGNLLVGTTSASLTGVGGYWEPSGRINLGKTGSSTYMGFYVNGTTVGSIATDGSITAYNTSSDYRLKNITGPITTSGAYIDSLNPVEGTWKADGSTFVGLIAHEVQEASRTNVATGVKDGEQMQGMDYSSAELIANMLAELKSLRARVAQLEAA